MLKVAAVAPMPSASVATTTSVKAGVADQPANRVAQILDDRIDHGLISERFPAPGPA